MPPVISSLDSDGGINYGIKRLMDDLGKSHHSFTSQKTQGDSNLVNSVTGSDLKHWTITAPSCSRISHKLSRLFHIGIWNSFFFLSNCFPECWNHTHLTGSLMGIF